jgi:uncharacterized membrane protein YgdD (TMEM256/DUF423 family)
MGIHSLSVGAFFCLLAVAGGALGAHSLSKWLDSSQMNAWETAIRFLMFHGLALMIFYLIGQRQLIPVDWPGWLITIGTVCFSGSIMLLVTAPLLKLRLQFLGPVTPIGGILLLAGWTWLIVSVIIKSFARDSG